MEKLAKRLMKSKNWIILDTETTGLNDYAELVQIGILAPNGTVLLDALVKPFDPIPPESTRIHGITDDMVANSPTFLDLFPVIEKIVQGKEVVVYNAPYDKRILEQSYAAYDTYVLKDLNLNATWTDIMRPYAEYWGAWSDYRKSYAWQKLVNACRQQDIEIQDAHSAIGDCRLSLALIQKLAEHRP